MTPSETTITERPPPRPRTRKWLFRIGVVAAIGVTAAIVYPRWGWWLHSFQEGPLGGPWRLPDGPINVVTYNIKFGKGLDEALKIVLEADPDVVCLQEIRPSQTAEIERRLGMEGHWTPSSNLIGDAAWGNAIFVRGRLDQVQSMTTPDGRSFGVWGVAETKGGRFVVGSIHLMHFKKKGDLGVRQRVREANAIIAAHQALGDAPAIIAGDFNEPTLGGLIHPMLSARFTDAAPDSGPTLPANVPLVRVDYIYCTGHWRASNGRSVATTISDHRPVMATLSPSSSK